MDTLNIGKDIKIPMAEIELTAVRARGAGGQNVNKVATAIHLRFDTAASRALPDGVKQKLIERADRRITDDGVIIIKSQAYRSQERNRQAALQRLVEILHSVLRVRKRRIATKPSRSAKQRRLDAKNRRGKLKQSRRRSFDD